MPFLHPIWTVIVAACAGQATDQYSRLLSPSWLMWLLILALLITTRASVVPFIISCYHHPRHESDNHNECNCCPKRDQSHLIHAVKKRIMLSLFHRQSYYSKHVMARATSRGHTEKNDKVRQQHYNIITIRLEKSLVYTYLHAVWTLLHPAAVFCKHF